VVGLIEYIPQKAAGRRTLPPMSLPIPKTSVISIQNSFIINVLNLIQHPSGIRQRQ
jgi:hypothetical protein